MHKSLECNKSIENISCTITIFDCKGLCILKKIIGNRTPVTAKTVLIGSKRKVGKPRKASLENQTVLQDIARVLILSSASLPLLVSILKKRGRPTLTA